MRRATLVAALAVAGCGSTYASGSLARTVPASTRLGCIEVGIARSEDRYRPGGPYDRPVVEVSLGNTCARPVTVHFERLAWTLASDGGTSALRISDPRHELRPLALDGYGEVHEKLELLGDAGAWSAAGAATRLCVDVTGFEADVRIPRGALCIPHPPPEAP